MDSADPVVWHNHSEEIKDRSIKSGHGARVNETKVKHVHFSNSTHDPIGIGVSGRKYSCYGKLIQCWRFVARYTMCGRV
jgi:hypothetical protein